MPSGAQPSKVVIVGGGIAGMEAAMAVADAGGRRVEIALVAPDTEFVLKPMVVRQPFGGDEPERHALEPALRRIGARHVRDSLTKVMPEERTVVLASGMSVSYDALIVCTGGRPRPAYSSNTITFWSTSGKLQVDELIARAAEAASRTLAIVIPPKMTWPLPAYELALLMRRRAQELGVEVGLRLLTPEDHPLGIFGFSASATVATRMAASHVEVETGTRVEEIDGALRRAPGAALDAGVVIALPMIEGPAVPGLPSADGFLRIDEHCRVLGTDSVYAAGDGTTFPVKQGGIAAQQADAAAAHIAASLGAAIDPMPFRPVLRGELLTGADSIKMRHSLTGGDAGSTSPDYLWWPRTKVSGRYLSAWLAGTEPARDLEPQELPIEVEASWPHEWHGQPMS